LWVDVDIVDKNIRADWNKYIFNLTDADDLLKREVQADCNVFDLATSFWKALIKLNKMKTVVGNMLKNKI